MKTSRARLSYLAESEKEAQALRFLEARAASPSKSPPRLLEEQMGQEELHLKKGHKPEWALLCRTGHSMPYYIPPLDAPLVRIYWGLKYWGSTPRVHIEMIVGGGGRTAVQWDPVRHREGLFFPEHPIVLSHWEPAGIQITKKSDEPFKGRIFTCYIQGKQIA